ncbi:FliG C-terminal domain-containing protein [Hasllibacter sp. MH4015]|uniref:FliG C-terminal domain-containing protein n=1 Tax=Hasllibacter sp. MH4015 TaxID=2854029 RepID=UPI001CD25BA4|nr:FliG C-terminal domain-containing protein [Hasllibacter sp. MH4015]
MGVRQDIFSDGDAVTLEGRVARDARVTARDVTPARLTSRQKAAVIVRLLLGQGVSPGVRKLPADHQMRLARAISDLKHIDRATLSEVVRDFTRQIDNLALSFPDTLSETVDLLAPHLADGPLDTLRMEAEMGDDPWSRVSRQDIDRLRPLLESESAEVCAVLLSKLSVAKAAALLADLPEERAQVLAHTVALTETVTPDLVARIGGHLAQVLDALPVTAFQASAAERVGAILNSTPQAARDKMLEGLEGRDTVFAGEVRKSIFAFIHIPARVDPADVPLVIRKVDGDTMSLALAAGLVAAPMSVEFILENISKRLAEQLRDEAETRGTPKPEDGEVAMAEVVSAIRALEAEGEIKLLAPED